MPAVPIRHRFHPPGGRRVGVPGHPGRAPAGGSCGAIGLRHRRLRARLCPERGPDARGRRSVLGRRSRLSVAAVDVAAVTARVASEMEDMLVVSAMLVLGSCRSVPA